MLPEARPVRIADISCCRSVRTFSMRVLEWSSTSFTPLNVLEEAVSGFMFIPVGSSIRTSRSGDESTDRLAHRHSHSISPDIQIENQDGQAVVAAHCHRRRIHHLHVLCQYLRIADLLERHSVPPLPPGPFRA